MNHSTPLPVVILISGRGSNMQAIHQAMLDNDLPIDIKAIITNEATAAGLDYAIDAGITSEIVSHKDFSSREDFDATLMQTIDRYQPALVILAGFMRILTTAFVEHYLGKLINIHPALLPAFPGLNTHARALEAGVKEHGTSVHYVTPEVDGGPVILQARVAVHQDDTAELLQKRVLEQEHVIYPLAIRLIAEGHVTFANNHAYYDNELLGAKGVNLEV